MDGAGPVFLSFKGAVHHFPRQRRFPARIDLLGVVSPAIGMIEMADGSRTSARPQPANRLKTGLLDPGSTTLNQNDQHNDKQRPSDNLDNRSAVHEDSPFVQKLVSSSS
jgi:hypothetical protein